MSKLYWMWRLSRWSRPWYAIKTFFFIQWNARKIAVMLDDCTRALGQMDHPSQCKTACKKCGVPIVLENPNMGSMLMKLEVRTHLIHRACWDTLPSNWKWRKD